MAKLMGEIELGEQIFWSSFAAHFIVRIDRLSRPLIVRPIEYANEVSWRKVANYFLNRSDETIKGARRLSLRICHRSYCIIRTKQKINRVNYEYFFHRWCKLKTQIIPKQHEES